MQADPSYMVDWITVVLPVYCRRDYSLGSMVLLDPDGAYCGRFERKFFCKNGDASAMVRMCPPPSGFDASPFEGPRFDGVELRFIRVEVCPSKWFFGHNLIGSADVGVLARDCVYSVLAALPPVIPLFELARLRRLDLTRSYAFGADADAERFIHALQMSAGMGWRRASNFNTTILWPGRAWSLKFYCKAPEIRSKRGHDEAAAKLAAGIVRAELTIRSEMLISERLDRLSSWSVEKVVSVHSSYVSRVRFGEVDVFDFQGLPQKAQLIFLSWQAGRAVSEFGAARTVRRHRKVILDAGGPDITLPPPPAGTVTAFRRVLRPEPWSPPAELLHCLQRPPARLPRAA